MQEHPAGKSLEQSKRIRKGFEGGIRGKLTGIVLGAPQHASLFSLVAGIPSPNGSVPICRLDSG